MPHDLYLVNGRVSPLPAHHLYWEIEAAELDLFLMAQSAEEALERASAILPILLFEGSDDHKVTVTLLKWPPLPEHSDTKPWMESARSFGFSLRIICWPPGGGGSLPNEAPQQGA